MDRRGTRRAGPQNGAELTARGILHSARDAKSHVVLRGPAATKDRSTKEMDRLNRRRMLIFIEIHEIVKSKNLIAPLIVWLVITLAAAHAAENANANATTAPGTSPSSP